MKLPISVLLETVNFAKIKAEFFRFGNEMSHVIIRNFSQNFESLLPQGFLLVDAELAGPRLDISLYDPINKLHQATLHL